MDLQHQITKGVLCGGCGGPCHVSRCDMLRPSGTYCSFVFECTCITAKTFPIPKSMTVSLRMWKSEYVWKACVIANVQVPTKSVNRQQSNLNPMKIQCHILLCCYRLKFGCSQHVKCKVRPLPQLDFRCFRPQLVTSVTPAFIQKRGSHLVSTVRPSGIFNSSKILQGLVGNGPRSCGLGPVFHRCLPIPIHKWPKWHYICPNTCEVGPHQHLYVCAPCRHPALLLSIMLQHNDGQRFRLARSACFPG